MSIPVKRLLSPSSIQSDVWLFIFIWNLSKSQLGTICIIMILDVGWLILQGSQINCILKVVRLIALNKEALRMQQRVMIKVYDYNRKSKNSIIAFVVLVTSKMLRQIKGWKIRSPSVEYGALKSAYLCDCSLYTLEILMHAPKPYFTKATFSHRVDSTIYFW